MSVNVVSDVGSGSGSWYITGFGSSQIAPEIEPDKRRLRSVVNRFGLRAVVRHMDPKSRVASCGRHIIPGEHYVSVRAAGQQASVNNLAMCGLLWVCPVCAARITEERRQEMKACLESAAKRFDFVTCLLTLTLRHYARHKLRESLDGLSRAYKRLTKGRCGMELRSNGWRHTIRAFEVTWGRASGWHPHLHVLLFCAPGTDVEQLREFIEEKWLEAVAAEGFASNEHAVNLKFSYGDVWSYVAKFGSDTDEVTGASSWGVSGELTKGHMKRGRNGRYTPFDLLRATLTGELSVQLVRQLYAEYAEAIKGRKQLVFSAGLKALLTPELEERADEEIAVHAGEELPEVARLTFRQWRTIFNRDAVADLLEVVALNPSSGAIRDFLEWIGCEETSTWVV